MWLMKYLFYDWQLIKFLYLLRGCYLNQVTNHPTRAINKARERTVMKKYTVFSWLLKILIKEKIIAKRKNKTWIIILVILMNSAVEILRTERIASKISRREPKIKNIKGIIFIIKKAFYIF